MTPQIDFGKTAQDYGRYRAGFPSALFNGLSMYRAGASSLRRKEKLLHGPGHIEIIPIGSVA